jgi:hypothetical protein
VNAPSVPQYQHPQQYGYAIPTTLNLLAARIARRLAPISDAYSGAVRIIWYGGFGAVTPDRKHVLKMSFSGFDPEPDIARLADRDSGGAAWPSPIIRRAHARSNCPCADNVGQTYSLANLDQTFKWKLLWLSDRIDLR